MNCKDCQMPLKIDGGVHCEICCGNYPEGKHNTDECISNDIEWDIECMDKFYIISLFKTNVQGKIFNGTNGIHNGKEGQWIESLFGISPNCKNKPDILGFELKKKSEKISFGDWSASEYLFTKDNSLGYYINRETFIRTFGTPNPKKNNRISWSGSCVPVIGKWNKYGQRLFVEKNEDIVARYCCKKDSRELTLFSDCIIAIWKKSKMEKHVNDKFNQRGFILVEKNIKGVYTKISFGKKITFDIFLTGIKQGIIKFDSGMKSKELRNYSQWRASSNFWYNLITEEYQ